LVPLKTKAPGPKVVRGPTPEIVPDRVVVWLEATLIEPPLTKEMAEEAVPLKPKPNVAPAPITIGEPEGRLCAVSKERVPVKREVVPV
jgi:hypothetical protein